MESARKERLKATEGETKTAVGGWRGPCAVVPLTGWGPGAETLPSRPNDGSCALVRLLKIYASFDIGEASMFGIFIIN
jgi:hypothetical protein